MVGIYKIENIKNGYVYIGQSVNIERRLKDHKRELGYNKHHNIYLQRAYNKYGESNFNFEIICECEKEKLNELETYYCNLYRPNVYNIGATNSAGTMSQEKRDKLSLVHKGKSHPQSENSKIKISNSLKGRKHYHSEETRRKISETLKGKRHKEESKNKLSLARKGKTHSEETKLKMSLSHKGKTSWNKGMTKEQMLEYKNRF